MDEKQECCGNCRFSMVNEVMTFVGEPITDIVWCRRNAPRVTDTGTTRWPTMRVTDWCGEWEAKEVDGSSIP